MKTSRWSELAVEMARRVAGEASWRDDRCSWMIEALVPETGRGRRKLAGGGIYQGSAGIALFLGEAVAAGAGEEVRRAALGGMEHALASAPDSGVSFSFHSGPLGIAWVATRLARLLERPDLARRGLRLLSPLRGREREDRGLDVIAGAAGAIPALLDLAARAGEAGEPGDGNELVAMARRLGEHLVDEAHREPDGWSWNTVGPIAARNLAGLAHGAAGVAVALLELARATGDGRFRFAAEMAFLYERRLFDEEKGNWPDLRHREVSKAYHQGGTAALRRKVSEEGVSPYEPVFMSAWCHGAPGGGLARVRAFELTGEAAYRREAEAALANTVSAVTPPLEASFCLCHGTAGNCELLLEAARVFRDPTLLEVCHRAAAFARDRYAAPGGAWPCGAIGGADDPSLLVGRAGMGHFLLRLAAAEAGRDEVPSVLLVRPAPATGPDREADGFSSLAREWVEEAFPGSAAACRRAGLTWPPPGVVPETAEPLSASPVERAYRALVELADGAGGELADALALEAAQHELAAAPPDRAESFARATVRPPEGAVDWEAVVVRQAAGLRRVTTRRDPAAHRPGAGEAAPARERCEWALQATGTGVVRRRLSRLAALVLDSLEEPAGLASIVSRIELEAEAEHRLLRRAVLDQVRELYRAGMLEARSGPAPHPLSRSRQMAG